MFFLLFGIDDAYAEVIGKVAASVVASKDSEKMEKMILTKNKGQYGFRFIDTETFKVIAHGRQPFKNLLIYNNIKNDATTIQKHAFCTPNIFCFGGFCIFEFVFYFGAAEAC